MKIAFIGLGTMGLPMAARLARAGHAVVGNDRDAAVQQGAAARGIGWEQTIAAAVADAEVVITMLPNGAVVHEAALGAGGIIERMRPQACYVDMSTIAPDETDALTAAFAGRGIAKLDAPVARSSKEAEDGTLLIMVGAEPAALEQVRPLLDAMGDTVLHCGPPGCGIRMKLVNNYMSLTINVVTAEALAMGQRAGLPLDVLTGVMSRTVAGKGHLTTTYPQKAFKRDLEPGFMIDLARKDLALIVAMSHGVGLPAATAQAASRIYDTASRAGRGGQDHTAVYDLCLNDLRDPAIAG